MPKISRTPTGSAQANMSNPEHSQALVASVEHREQDDSFNWENQDNTLVQFSQEYSGLGVGMLYDTSRSVASSVKAIDRQIDSSNRGSKRQADDSVRKDIFENISDAEEVEEMETRKKSRRDQRKMIKGGLSQSPIKLERQKKVL